MSSLLLKDLCELIVDCKNRTPPEAPPGEGIAFAIGTPHIDNGRIRLQDAKPVTRETFETWTARAVPRVHDIVLTREAPVGRVGGVEDGMSICLGQRTMLLRADPNLVNPQYLKYLLLGPQVQQALHSQASGSTVPHLRVDQVRNLPVPNIPALPTQRAIASMLGALDDKIAVNERIANSCLELAGLTYSEAAKASHGWEPIQLGTSSRWFSGGTPKTSEPTYWDGNIPWISALSLKSPWIDDSDRKLTRLGAGSGTRIVPSETILFVVRGSSLKSEFRIGITQREVAFGQDCKALIANDRIDPHLLFHAIRSKTADILDMVDETSIGAGRLPTDLISKLEVRIPRSKDSSIVKELRDLDRCAAQRQAENRALAALRDTLLPQLMSGKLRVRDAERIVESSV